MKKQKKLKYYVAQVGGNVVYNNPFQQDNAMYAGESEPPTPGLNPRTTPNTGDVGSLPTHTVVGKKKYLQMNAQANELNPAFLGINALALGAHNIGAQVNDIKTHKDELRQYLEAVNPTSYENNDRYGLNDLPAYTKNGGEVTKYQVGGAVPGQMTTVEDQNPYNKKKPPVLTATQNSGAKIAPKQTRNNSSAPFKNSQGDELTMGWTREFSDVGGKVKDAVYAASKQTGVDPALLYSSAMQEGMNKNVFRKNNKSEAYMNNYDKLNKMSPGMNLGSKFDKQFPVDGFYSYGLDTFGDQYKDLQKKGYLPADFDKQFQTYDAMNDAKKPQKVNTAAFKTDQDALIAKAAMMRDTQDQIDSYAKKNKVILSPDARNFFTAAGYNSGIGNAYGMIKTYNQKGYLKDDSFLKDTFKPGKGEYAEVITNNRPRILNAQRLKKQGLFNDYPSMQTGGEIPQTDGLSGKNKKLANVEAEKGEAFMNNDGQVGQVADDAATHEQGGVALPDVHRVLENTSNLRSDTNSKYLKLEPKQIEGITGLKTTKSMSHAEALVKANENNEVLRTKILKNITLASKGKKNLDKYAEESTKLNVQHFSAIPSQQELFNKLFEHQEFVKNTTGIPSGKLDKGQYGIDTSSWLPNPSDQPAPEPFKGVWKKDKNGKLQLYKAPSASSVPDLSINPATEQPNTAQEVSVIGGRQSRGRAQTVNTEDLIQQNPDGSTDQNTTKTWDDSQLPPDANTPPSTKVMQALDTSITNNLKLKNQKGSEFNEPLRWYDVASSVNAYMAGSERIGEKYNPVHLSQLRYKLQDPTTAINKNTGDFNAAVQAVQNSSAGNTGVQLANIANLTAQKYNFNNQVLGNYENQNAQIKNNEILYNTQVRDKQEVADQQAREVFEEKVLTGKAKQQEQKLTALDSLYKTIAENRALNRNGNLMMKFSRAFDQYGNYNGYQTQFQINPTLGLNTPPQTATTGKAGSNAAGGIQNVKQGQTYYNRKTGKTYYFNGQQLVER